MPKPTNNWTRPYKGITHFTGVGFHATVRQWDSMVNADIYRLDPKDNTWEGFTPLNHRVFGRDEFEEAKKWAEDYLQIWNPYVKIK